MIDNVVHAFGAAPPSDLEKEMLAAIDGVVADIKAGQILGVAIAAVTRDGRANTAWARQAGQHFALLGAIGYLSQRMGEAIFEE